MLIVTLGSIVLNADVLQVCPRCPLQRVEDAVKQATAGDTIALAAGVYPDTHVLIEKSLFIVGTGRPILDGNGQGTVLTVRRATIHLQGVVVANTGYSAIDDRAGIKLLESEGSSICDIEAINCSFGVALYRSPRTRIQRIHARGTGAVESQSGNGIHLWKSPACTIADCTVQQHRDGLYIEFSNSCTIENNRSIENLRYGLHFMFSDSNTYQYNVFYRNGAGVAVMYSQHVRMEQNVFAHNWGPSSYGLLLKDISRSAVRGNLFDRNTVGIYLEGSNNTVIAENIFRSNGWALKVLGSCTDDTVANNNFIVNTFDVMSNTSNWELSCYGNYWDQYHGYDFDRDGYGDVPYRPVSVFSLIIERIPMAVLLLRSFLVELLTYIERAMPTLIPSQLADPQPRMNPLPLGATAEQVPT